MNLGALNGGQASCDLNEKWLHVLAGAVSGTEKLFSKDCLKLDALLAALFLMDGTHEFVVL